MSSLHDVAKSVGVSVATVSRALNDKPGVSDVTRQRVLEAARALRYWPNSTARSLTTSRTRTVLFVTHRHKFPPSKDPFYAQIIRGLEETLALESYNLMLVTLTDEQLAAGPESLPMLQDRRADGLVLAGPDIPPSFVLGAAASDLSVMLVDNALRDTQIPAVLADNEGGCRAATCHLIESHGHRVVGLLRGAEGWATSEERASGYCTAVDAAGLTPRVISVSETTIDSGFEAANQALDAYPEMSAMVAVNDAMAIGAMRAAAARGHRVPADLAVVGFDNISWAKFAEPPLTTVNVPTVEMGRLAARLIVDRFEGVLTVASRTVLAGDLVIRASCGCDKAAETPD